MAHTFDSLMEIFRNRPWKNMTKKKQGTPVDTPIDSPSSSSRSSRSNSEQDEDINSYHSNSNNGNTFYIKDCTGITIGDKYTYYTGPVKYNQKQYTSNANTKQLHDLLEEDQPEMVEKDNDIVSLMECTSKPTSKYLLHTAAYTGRTWRRTFVNIGIDERIIENYLYENPREPIREIRYQILLDWLRNSENATLGYLSTNLWKNGHRQLVNELASMYREERLNEEPELEL